MRPLVRIILMFMALGPAVTCFAMVRAETFTISGSTGLPGVVMKGLPGDPITRNDGTYRATVEYGWSGTVTPLREGYVFNPASRTYSEVTSSQDNENYTAQIITFTISGSVGIPGVMMQGLPGNPVSASDGTYEATVLYGWTGTVTPTKEGYVFNPASRIYSEVTSSQDNQNYTAERRTFTISGSTGVGAVAMRGLPGYPITKPDGSYTATVEYGWRGVITPTKEGYGFDPPTRTYEPVKSDIHNQDYAPQLQMFTISGKIAIGRTPVSGVKVLASNGGGSDTTDSQGRYSVQVPYGWSGEITLEKEGFKFDPPSKSYTHVTTNIRDGLPEMRRYGPRLPYEGTVGWRYGRTTGRADRGKVLVIPTTEVKREEFEAMREDMHVMLYILEKELRKPRLIQGVLFDYGDFFEDSRTFEAMYVQDYGAFFFIEVDFPLIFPPESQEIRVEKTEEQVDPIWQRAKQEMFSSQDPTTAGQFPGRQEHGLETLEELKKDLTRLLKHASNIRHLKGDEWVILTVIGAGEWIDDSGMMAPYGTTTGTKSKSRGSGSMYGTGGYGGYGGGGYGGYGGGGGYGGYGGFGGGYGVSGFGYGGMGGYEMVPASSATLTMRVKRADVDAFAKGELDFEQFQQQVKTLTY